MFNTTYINGGSQSHYHKHDIKVTEKRAATDESIKIFNEMKDKAKQEILEGYFLDTNYAKGSLIVSKEAKNMCSVIDVLIKINNHEYHFEERIKDYDRLDLKKDDYLRMIYEKIGMSISEKLMNEAMNNNESYLREFVYGV